MIRVVFAEDNYLVREGTAALLATSDDIELVGTAESKDELVRRTTPYATVVGTRGGSPLAAAAVNALLQLASEDVDG